MIATILVQINRTKGPPAEPGDFFPSLRRPKVREAAPDLQERLLRSFGFDPDKLRPKPKE